MKKKIAVFANAWNGENLDSFINGLNDIFNDDNVDIFVFSSHSSYGQSDIVRRAEDSIYGMPDYSLFDAAIIFCSGLNSDKALEDILCKCKEANLPVVVQGMDIEGVDSVTVDNYSGMRSLCDHLIEKHDVKDVVFLAGPADNDDSNLRLKATRESLETHGLFLDEACIEYANWEGGLIYSYIMDTYKGHKEKLPDAIVCANDVTALFAFMFLEMIDIKSPEDVIVTGFDNLNAGRVYFPSLSSVDQCYREQGLQCAKLVLEKIKDTSQVVKKIIPCTAIPGESCGCINCNNENEIRKMLGHDMWVNKLEIDKMKGRESALEISIMSSGEYADIADNIRTEFFTNRGKDLNSVQLYLNPEYKDLKYMNALDVDFSESYYSPVMDVIASKTDGVVNSEKKIDIKNLFIGYDKVKGNKIYVFNPIRVDNAVAGYNVLEHSKEAFANTRYFDYINRLNKTLKQYQSSIKLANLNEKLSELMQKDALTNVKNRVAYDNYVARLDSMISMGIDSQVAVVMCDINNLKTVNDNLGHDAGDVYIKNCCNTMCNIFKHSPIFRTGGDEFIIIISTSDYSVRNELLDNLKNKMSESEKNSSPLTRISIATGISDFDPKTDKSILEVVKRADALMYSNKAKMKAKKTDK